MRISTEIHSIARIAGMERAIELVAAAGFDCWDLSMFDMAKLDRETLRVMDNDHPLHSSDYAAFVKRLRLVGEDCGITCNQAHAPYPSRGREMMDYLKRAIECAAIAGASICVVHPDNNKSAEENAELYGELLPTAKEFGVRIAAENMWNWNKEAGEARPAACSHHEDFVRHIRAVNDPFLVACLDVGHAEMRGLDTSAPEMICALGSSLRALHLHDNDRHRDCHQPPGTMAIDFDEVLSALAQIGYEGDFTLEAYKYLLDFDETTVRGGIRELARSARALAERYDQIRGKE